MAIFDLLTRPDPELSRKEKREVKTVAHELLEALAAARITVEKMFGVEPDRTRRQARGH